MFLVTTTGTILIGFNEDINCVEKEDQHIDGASCIGHLRQLVSKDR